MDTWMIIGITAAASIIVAAIVVAIWEGRRHRNRTERLQEAFGSEYDRAVATKGKSSGEAELANREERLHQLSVRPLLPFEIDRFARMWTATQARFVDEPGSAVADADRLVCDVMLSRGYDVGDFEQRAADVSVDHKDVVANYRSAHALSVKHSRGQATTEDLRRAMVHYRALFTELCDNATTMPSLDDSRDGRVPAGVHFPN